MTATDTVSTIRIIGLIAAVARYLAACVADGR